MSPVKFVKKDIEGIDSKPTLCLKKFLDQWDIREDQVMLIVSDNGSNMVKAIRLLQEVHAPKKSNGCESYEFESDGSEY